MLAAVDVDHRERRSVAAAVLFRSFGADSAERELLAEVDAPPAPYVPGELYRRELPALLAVLRAVEGPLEAIVVDGYVFLDDAETPGLGAHLHRALDSRVPVIGVAKTPYRGARLAVPVLRGESQRPLFVTAAGMDAHEAARRVAAMHGDHRVPTLLRRVDRLCREGRAARSLRRGA